jgi:transcriptional regulator with XRE-family HTH domain
MKITPATCRAARGLLDWTQKMLAYAANVGLSTVKSFENGSSTPVANNLEAIRRALESAGVEFLPGNGAGPGVRMRGRAESEAKVSTAPPLTALPVATPALAPENSSSVSPSARINPAATPDENASVPLAARAAPSSAPAPDLGQGKPEPEHQPG